MNEPLPLFPSLLPSVPFDARAELPPTSGVYFALDDHGDVLYVGATKNLHQRWQYHDRYDQFQANQCRSIAYYVCPVEGLTATERAMILQFAPPLNSHMAHWYSPNVQRTSMPTIRPTSWRLSPDARRLLSTLAQQMGINQREVLETAIRLLAKHENVE